MRIKNMNMIGNDLEDITKIKSGNPFEILKKIRPDLQISQPFSNDALPAQQAEQKVKLPVIAIKTPLKTTNKITFNGTVRDSLGEGIPYASVNSKDSNVTWTETDSNGKFSILADINEVFIVQSMGFNPIEISASNIQKSIVLYENAEELPGIEIITKLKKKPNYLLYGGIAGSLLLGYILLKPASNKGLKGIAHVTI